MLDEVANLELILDRLLLTNAHLLINERLLRLLLLSIAAALEDVTENANLASKQSGHLTCSTLALLLLAVAFGQDEIAEEVFARIDVGDVLLHLEDPVLLVEGGAPLELAHYTQ